MRLAREIDGSRKKKVRKIRIVPDDRVTAELDGYNLNRGRIVWRQA